MTLKKECADWCHTAVTGAGWLLSSHACTCLLDKGHRGPLMDWIKTTPGWETEIVPKTENNARQQWELVDGVPVQVHLPKGGFHVQRHWWKVERTFG